jgi:hypothetical protein
MMDVNRGVRILTRLQAALVAMGRGGGSTVESRGRGTQLAMEGKNRMGKYELGRPVLGFGWPRHTVMAFGLITHKHS